MAEMLATNPLPAQIRIEKQIAGFQAPAFPALAGQLPVMPGRILVRRAIKATAEHFGTSPDVLVSARRTRPLVRWRQVAMYVAREMTGRSLPFIGKKIGDRDHTTILHGVRAVESLLDAGDVATTVAVQLITERLQVLQTRRA
jgi:chromosomal replication initiation ATPase DnaA